VTRAEDDGIFVDAVGLPGVVSSLFSEDESENHSGLSETERKQPEAATRASGVVLLLN
jgi:inosine/xanthosine triphosphate pyrophosphatase family protein